MSGWTAEQLFSSDRQDWATPQALFDVLDREFYFALDAAASVNNTKCREFYSKEDDALTQPWCVDAGEAVWLNPPYGREIGKWIKKAYEESQKGFPVVCLTFCRTDTRWWHEYAMRAAEIRLVPGRITFVGADAGAPAPSCLLVFDESRRSPRFVAQHLPRK